MASSGKKKTTMAKRDRENRLRERRAIKQAKKDARKLAAQSPEQPMELAPGELAPMEMAPSEQVLTPDGPPQPEV